MVTRSVPVLVCCLTIARQIVELRRLICLKAPGCSFI
jgi:hypothetical protein